MEGCVTIMPLVSTGEQWASPCRSGWVCYGQRHPWLRTSPLVTHLWLCTSGCAHPLVAGRQDTHMNAPMTPHTFPSYHPTPTPNPENPMPLSRPGCC